MELGYDLSIVRNLQLQNTLNDLEQCRGQKWPSIRSSKVSLNSVIKNDLKRCHIKRYQEINFSNVIFSDIRGTKSDLEQYYLERYQKWLWTKSSVASLGLSGHGVSYFSEVIWDGGRACLALLIALSLRTGLVYLQEWITKLGAFLIVPL